MTTTDFRNMALSFPGTIENPHFDRAAFKIINKRIFCTMHEESGTANLKLSPADQRVYCEYDKKIIYAIPNKWGVQGWTTFELKKMTPQLMLDALDAAYKDANKPKAGKGKSKS
jgi:hypothetical protein